jgi:exosome complex component RRP46
MQQPPAANSSVMDTSEEGIAAAEAAARAAALAPAPVSDRPDNRLASELRPISVEHGVLSRADGSAQWSQAGSSVLVGVYGPVLVPGRDEKIDRATVSVHFKAASGQASNIDIERGSYIRQCVEPVLHLTSAPRCKISIHVQVLRDGGSILSCALNAVSLALIDAGVPATAVLSAVCVAVAPPKDSTAAAADGSAASANAGASSKAAAAASSTAAASAAPSFLLDPVSSEESTLGSATLTLAFASTSPGAVLSVVERGSIGAHAFADATLIGRAACQHVLQFMRLSLERKHANA